MGLMTVTDEWSPKMDEEEKMDLMRFTEKEEEEEEEQKNHNRNLEESFFVIDNDDVDNRRLLTGLINQLETLRDDEQVCQPGVAEEEASSSSSDLNPKSKSAVEAESLNSESERQDIIIKELNKMKRQNVITHCLVSAMILLTLAWQVSEVSLILKVKGKVKDGMSHPFRSVGSMITGILKRNDDHDSKRLSPKRDTDAAFPALPVSNQE